MALPNIAKYFKEQSHEEREHAQKLIDYQIMRGGNLVLSDVKAPEIQNWGSALNGESSRTSRESALLELVLAGLF